MSKSSVDRTDDQQTNCTAGIYSYSRNSVVETANYQNKRTSSYSRNSVFERANDQNKCTSSYSRNSVVDRTDDQHTNSTAGIYSYCLNLFLKKVNYQQNIIVTIAYVYLNMFQIKFLARNEVYIYMSHTNFFRATRRFGMN
jgi:hypothetical protein